MTKTQWFSIGIVLLAVLSGTACGDNKQGTRIAQGDDDVVTEDTDNNKPSPQQKTLNKKNEQIFEQVNNSTPVPLPAPGRYQLKQIDMRVWVSSKVDYQAWLDTTVKKNTQLTNTKFTHNKTSKESMDPVYVNLNVPFEFSITPSKDRIKPSPDKTHHLNLTINDGIKHKLRVNTSPKSTAPNLLEAFHNTSSSKKDYYYEFTQDERRFTLTFHQQNSDKLLVELEILPTEDSSKNLQRFFYLHYELSQSAQENNNPSQNDASSSSEEGSSDSETESDVITEELQPADSQKPAT